MPYSIRKIRRADIPQIVKLLFDYMRETYGRTWDGTAERLEADAFDGLMEILAAENETGEIVGFIACSPTYDLHHCFKGGEVIDFFVSTQHRGRGVGLLLAIELAAEIQRRGGAFLKGGAVENPAARHFYNHLAMVFPNGDCYISGRAFRHLAGLSGESNVRKIVGNLPETAWNYEP